MEIYVVRHCSTECSEKRIYCGVSDVPLSPAGLSEAERLRARADEFPIAAVVSSPLLRARRTAEALVGGRDIPIFLDARLAERNFGALEGTSCAREDGKRFRFSFARRYPGGESNLDVAVRVYAFLQEVLARAEHDVALVSHGSACRIIRTYFKEMSDEEFYAYSQPPGSVEVYEVSKGPSRTW